MTAEFDAKSNTLTLRISVNPKSTAPSSTGKTHILGNDRLKFDCDGREATVAVNVYVPLKKGKK